MPQGLQALSSSYLSHDYIFTIYFGSFFCSYDAYEVKSGIGRFANDEWIRPNCVMRMRQIEGVPYLFLFALRDVDPGSELRYDYGDPTAPWR